jgi:hypothetical protein
VIGDQSGEVLITGTVSNLNLESAPLTQPDPTNDLPREGGAIGQGLLANTLIGGSTISKVNVSGGITFSRFKFRYFLGFIHRWLSG